GGSIGASGNDVEIDSQYRAAGDVGLEATNNIFLTETDSTLKLLLAEALNGSVRLTVRETTPDAAPSATTLDEDLDLIASGSVRFVENVLRSVPKGRIAALNGFVLLQVGDDVTTSANSEIVAKENIDIYGDYTNADAGYGTNMVLRGILTSGYLATGSASP